MSGASAFARRAIYLSMLAGAALAAWNLGIAQAQDAPPYKIGLLVPLSGPGAGGNADGAQQGIALAVQEINADNLAGRKVEVIVADDASDPRTAVDVCNRLILSDKVDAIVSQGPTPVRIACNQAAMKAGTPHIVTVMSQPDLCFPNMVLIAPETTQLIGPFLDGLVAQGLKRIYFLGNDYSAPRDAYAAAKKVMSEKGATDVGVSFIPFNTPDFSSEIAKIADAKPDVVILGLPGPDGVAFHRQFSADPRVTSIKRAEFFMLPPNVLSKLGDAVNGIYVVAPYFDGADTPSNAAYKSGLTKMYGDKALPDFWSAAVFTATHMLALAVKKGGADPKAVLASLQGMSFDGPGGKTTINNNFSVSPVYVGNWANGKATVLKSYADVTPAPRCK